MTLFNLLESSSESANTNKSSTGWIMWVVLGVFLVGWIVMSYFTNKKRKKQAEEETQKRNSIKPGFTVTTIGGIVGTVVSVDDENSTFVLETGSAEHPSQLKFDKLAIYNSFDPNAVAEQTAAPEDDKKNDEVFDGVSSETEEVSENAEQPAEESKAEENTDKE